MPAHDERRDDWLISTRRRAKKINVLFDWSFGIPSENGSARKVLAQPIKERADCANSRSILVEKILTEIVILEEIGR